MVAPVLLRRLTLEAKAKALHATQPPTALRNNGCKLSPIPCATLRTIDNLEKETYTPAPNILGVALQLRGVMQWLGSKKCSLYRTYVYTSRPARLGCRRELQQNNIKAMPTVLRSAVRTPIGAFLPVDAVNKRRCAADPRGWFYHSPSIAVDRKNTWVVSA